MGKTESWGSIIGDLFLVAGCLALATWLFSASDPLWLRLNPSPLILPPFLLGGRYGIIAGIVSGCLAAAAGLASVALSGEGEWLPVLHENRFLFAALPLAGGVAGELRSALTRARSAAAERILDLTETVMRTSTALRVSEESGHRLERQLALHGLEMVSLENELSAILRAEGDDVFRETLRALRHVTGLREAAVYVPTEGTANFRRASVLSAGEEMPESLNITEPIVERALLSRELVTCRELWHEVPDQRAMWIAALPWVDHQGKVCALLLVKRMPLLSIHWPAFDRMKTICQWVTCCRLITVRSPHALAEAERKLFKPAMDEAPEAGDTLSESYVRLEEAAALCVRSLRLHELPSTGANIRGAGELCLGNGEAITKASAELRPCDVLVPDPDSNNLIVLMPLLDEAGAEQAAVRVTNALTAAKGQTTGDELVFACVPLRAEDTAKGFLERLRRAHS